MASGSRIRHQSFISFQNLASKPHRQGSGGGRHLFLHGESAGAVTGCVGPAYRCVARGGAGDAAGTAVSIVRAGTFSQAIGSVALCKLLYVVPLDVETDVAIEAGASYGFAD